MGHGEFGTSPMQAALKSYKFQYLSVQRNFHRVSFQCAVPGSFFFFCITQDVIFLERNAY